MGKRFFIIYIFVCGLMLFSCKKTTIKDTIDGGNFKFWFRIDESGEIEYRYFGNDGRYEVFIRNESHGFHRYGSCKYEDDLPPEKWFFKKDSIGWNSEFEYIVDINDYRIVTKYKNHLDTMYSCYEGMIPVNYYHRW